MPVLKAIKKFRYDKIKLRPGDVFKVRDSDVAILVHGGFATRPDAPLTYSTRHMEAETPRIVEVDKLEAEAPNYSERTVAELRQLAVDRGIELPSGYIAKSKLLDIMAKG